MNRRRAIAVLALVGALVSVYLLLHKLGFIGSLACTTAAGCDVVNTSPYSTFLGLPVAAYGVGGYLIILTVAVGASEPGRERDPVPDRLLAALAGVGAAFSAYLTYVSLFVIGTACPWCLLSFAIILAIFGTSLWGVLSIS